MTEKKSRIEMSIDAAKARDAKLIVKIKNSIGVLDRRIEADTNNREKLYQNLNSLGEGNDVESK